MYCWRGPSNLRVCIQNSGRSAQGPYLTGVIETATRYLSIGKSCRFQSNADDPQIRYEKSTSSISFQPLQINLPFSFCPSSISYQSFLLFLTFLVRRAKHAAVPALLLVPTRGISPLVFSMLSVLPSATLTRFSGRLKRALAMLWVPESSSASAETSWAFSQPCSVLVFRTLLCWRTNI